MKAIFREMLFGRHILVSEAGATSGFCVETLVALARLYGIEVVCGAQNARPEMIRLAGTLLGAEVPEPFYRGFPATVRELTSQQLLFDQLAHYSRTYGMGDFSRPGHSLLEGRGQLSGAELVRAVMDELDGAEGDPEALLAPRFGARTPLEEQTKPRQFVILNEEEAVEYLRARVDDLLRSTRPLSRPAEDMAVEFLREYGGMPDACACKQTAIALMLELEDVRYARFIRLADVVVLADEMNRRAAVKRGNDGGPGGAERDARRLNLPNRCRAMLKTVIDEKLRQGEDIRACYSRRARWCALLHQIHYKPFDAASAAFVDGMRGGPNRSVESEFERALAQEGPVAAARVLSERKGPGAVLRHLDYLLSRCGSEREMGQVLDRAETRKPLLLIQMLLRYANDRGGRARNFRFAARHMLSVHRETPEEAARRRSRLPAGQIECVRRLLAARLGSLLKGRLNRVYIDPAMKRMAPPIQHTASVQGFGTLCRGSRLPLDADRTVRCFTYWDGVDDIDLSAIGIGEDGGMREFSWRTMGMEKDELDAQRPAILYSGDETSGFEGGSEYFDVDIAAFRRQYPDVRLLVFCDNIFTEDVAFDGCACRAGYMLRERVDSGEIYEPKTVASAFRITGEGRFAWMFGIDLIRGEFIWLNLLGSANAAVAGEVAADFLLDYLNLADVFSVFDLFDAMATERVDDPALADVIVTDALMDAPVGAKLIHSWDVEEMLGYLNG